jgi:uncharacterized protein YggE
MKRFLLPLLIVPISVFAQGGLPDKPYTYVKGTAEIKKPADMVTLRFDVVGRAPDQPKANQDVQTKANKILELVKSAKIADNDIIAEDLKSEPEFEQDESYNRGRGKLVDYKVTRPFQIRVRDIAAFPKLVDQLLSLGGTEFSGIEGGLQKEKEVESEAWDKALANAQERAEKTLKQMGMKIESVFAVSPVTFPEIQSHIFGTEGTVAGVRAYAEGPAGPQYRVAPVEISQDVHVIYLISPAK